MVGAVRSFANFTDALEEVKNARIFEGIHFRTACNHGQQLGIATVDFGFVSSRRFSFAESRLSNVGSFSLAGFIRA